MFHTGKTRFSVSMFRLNVRKFLKRFLDPSNAWGNKDEYWKMYDALAARYIENFKLFSDGCPDEVIAAGPKRI